MDTAGDPEESTSDEIFDTVCTPCKRKNKRRKAEKYCSACESQLCSSCLNPHNAFHDDHELFAPSDAADFRMDIAAYERCGKHPKLIIEGFCVSCNELLCHICTFKHRECGSAVVSIPKKIKELYKDADVKKIHTKLQETLTKLRSGTAGIKRGINAVRKTKMDAVGKVRTHFEKLATILKAIEAKAIFEVETICANIEDEMQAGTEEAEHLEAGIKECLGKVSTGHSSTEAQLFINMKNGETLVSSADEVLQKTDKPVGRTLGTYRLDGRIERYLGRINTIGVFKPTYSVKNTVRYNVQMSGEHECSIYYSCLLPGGRVLLSDFTNNRLKCFSPSSNKVTEICSVPSSPRGVCRVSTQEVAVSLQNKTVQFVTFAPSLTLSRSFKVGHNCWGITYRDGVLFITDMDANVYMHNLKGSLVQVITILGVSHTRDVALSTEGELLYVTSTTGVTCLDRRGRSAYTGGAGEGNCTGVCVDECGCVVVSDYGSDSVVQVGENGEIQAELLGREVLSKLLGRWGGMSSPWSVCVDSNNRKLYVTSERNNILLMADLFAE